ncbi:hypothetical protein DL98DRAFT_8967 [Cadophora sp. DSE1049]|nr:hypothetical protein DL98DRAFT_8967 [Cadophora sp. DSE1049]
MSHTPPRSPPLSSSHPSQHRKRASVNKTSYPSHLTIPLPFPSSSLNNVYHPFHHTSRIPPLPPPPLRNPLPNLDLCLPRPTPRPPPRKPHPRSLGRMESSSTRWSTGRG